MADESDSVRPFPLPWTISNSDSAFWIEDAEGKRFAYCYFDDRPRSADYGGGSRLTRAEALVIVRNIAKLPRLLGK
jgi:hypothetical protein